MYKILFFSMFLSCALVAQNKNETYSMRDLQVKFQSEKYDESILEDFRKTILDLRKKPELSEDIPGEIISWFTLNGRYSIHQTYRIKNDSLVEVKTIPNNAKFLDKINSYVPEKSKFHYGYDLWSFAFVKEKLDENYYLIKATTKSFNSHPEIPNKDILIYDLEYKTSDFVHFELIRLKDIHSNSWTEVEE